MVVLYELTWAAVVLSLDMADSQSSLQTAYSLAHVDISKILTRWIEVRISHTLLLLRPKCDVNLTISENSRLALLWGWQIVSLPTTHAWAGKSTLSQLTCVQRDRAGES